MSLNVTVTDEGKGLEAEVDDDIAKFNRFFQAIGNEPLTQFEVSAIKTYLAWKTKYKDEQVVPASPT